MGRMGAMNTNSLMGGLYRLCEWIARLAYLNLVWIFFTSLGAGLFGVFPATVSMFYVARKWIMKEDVPLLHTFFKTYKVEFVKANLLGWPLTIVGLLLVIDLRFFNMQLGPLYKAITVAMLTLVFLFAILVLYIFPVYVHYQCRFLQYYKNALFIAAANPLRTLVLAAGSVGIGLLILYFTQTILFFGVSLWCIFSMALTYRTFLHVEELQTRKIGALEQALSSRE
jgi:uncharacterized membrane protein YesL